MSVIVTAASKKRWPTKIPYIISNEINDLAKESVEEITWTVHSY